MPTEIIDLDLILGEPIEVQLGGQVYKLPPDIPAELFLKMAAYDGADNVAVLVTEIQDELLDLFKVHQPDMQTLPGTLTQMVALVPMVYGGRGSAEAADPPKAKAKGGTKSGSRKKTTRSRSSS